MSGVPLRFALNDGELLTIPEAQVSEIYELLWQLAPRKGAVSVAAAIRGMSGDPARYGPPIDLTAPQSAALREAVALLRAEPSG